MAKLRDLFLHILAKCLHGTTNDQQQTKKSSRGEGEKEDRPLYCDKPKYLEPAPALEVP